MRDCNQGETALDDRSILLTGAASGIGAATARRAARPGTRLLLHTRQSADLLENVASEARERGAAVETALGDLAEEGVAADLVQRAAGAFGSLDIVVANAGFPLFQSFAEGSAADEDAFRAEARRHIAGYKLPKAFVYVDRITRSPSGKADYKWASQAARKGLGLAE